MAEAQRNVGPSASLRRYAHRLRQERGGAYGRRSADVQGAALIAEEVNGRHVVVYLPASGPYERSEWESKRQAERRFRNLLRRTTVASDPNGLISFYGFEIENPKLERPDRPVMPPSRRRATMRRGN